MQTRSQGSRGAEQDALYPRAQAAAARHQAGLRAAADARKPTPPARPSSAPWSRTSRSPSAPRTCSARTPAFRSTTSSSAATSSSTAPRMKEAIRRGCERATKEHPLRSSVVHPITRKNEQTSCGVGMPVINVDFDEREETVEIEMIPKGSGSENGSFLQMLIPADGVAAVKRFVIDKVIECGGRVCPPTIVGVGIGGTSDLCMHLAKIAATRPLGTACADPEGAKIEAQLSEAVNQLGIGPQGLGGRATAFRVHVEVAATHITMNPVAVNIQCHSARRASAIDHARRHRSSSERAHDASRPRHADHRGAGARAARRRHRHAGKDAVRHPRRHADRDVRPRPHDALRPQGPRGHPHRAQCAQGRSAPGQLVRLRAALHRHHHLDAHGALHPAADAARRRQADHRQGRHGAGDARRLPRIRRRLSGRGRRRRRAGDHLDRGDRGRRHGRPASRSPCGNSASRASARCW